MKCSKRYVKKEERLATLYGNTSNAVAERERERDREIERERKREREKGRKIA
jgi:hypothetical protein